MDMATAVVHPRHPSQYRRHTSHEQRRLSRERAIARFPDRVPVVAEPNSADCPALDRFKFLVPQTMTFSHFTFVVRCRLKLDPASALFLFVGNHVPSGSTTMQTVYSAHKDPDDAFLYIRYDKEKAFG